MDTAMNQPLMSFAVLALAWLPFCSSFAQDIQGTSAAGEKKATLCIGCHGIKGYRASFPEIYRVPMIAGQGAKYIVAALGAYQKGERKHPTMRGIAADLSEQDKADLAAYYETLGKTAGAAAAGQAVAASARVTALLTKGGCVACHGDNFSRPLDPSYPKIAGQHGDYLWAALKAYKTENNPKIGRTQAIMSGVVQQFSKTELKELADYVSALPGELKSVPQKKFK